MSNVVYSCVKHTQALALSMYTGQLRDMLVPVFSEKGSNKRVKEEQAFIYFIDFLDECEGTYYFIVNPCRGYNIQCCFVCLSIL